MEVYDTHRHLWQITEPYQRGTSYRPNSCKDVTEMDLLVVKYEYLIL